MQLTVTKICLSCLILSALSSTDLCPALLCKQADALAITLVFDSIDLSPALSDIFDSNDHSPVLSECFDSKDLSPALSELLDAKHLSPALSEFFDLSDL